MAASCMGAFGTYQYAYGRDKQELVKEDRPNGETAWVIKRYIPTDLRATAPVQRYKPMPPDVKTLPPPESHWIPPGLSTPKTFCRDKEEERIYTSQPSTRCEEWSTLRAMAPSSGGPCRARPPNWGTGVSLPPLNTWAAQKRFPHINSPMTRYVDEMHLTNRLFKLH